MDIIQGLIETGNAGKPGWRIVNNGGAIGVYNNRTSNVLFSILNDGGIGTSSNISSTFINSYSGINVSNYTGTGVVSSGGTGGTGGSSQWTTSGSKIYYNNGTSGNIGIGTLDPIAPLHIYNTSNTRLLLDATTTGTATVEFRRGTGVDALNDYRFINDSNSSNGSLKLQCENSTQVFGNTVADLAWFSSNETIIHKNTTMNGRVGVGTVYHASRSLDVVGDANVSGVLSVAGSLSVTSNAVLTNSITSNTSFTIHNGLLPPLPNEIAVVPLASEIVVAGTTSGIIGTTDRYISFPYSGTGATKDYTFTATENLICDILIVGGGGGGGYDRAGGGGAGGLLLYTNTSINTGTYTIKVGKGGVGATTASINGTNGGSSSIEGLSGFIALGGGGGASANPGLVSSIGGSGGGGAGNDGWGTNTGAVGTSGQGNKGGNSVGQNSGGGGGAGGVGGNGVSGTNPGNSGNGGVGLNMSSYFGTSVGQLGWFAGGGGGSLAYDNFTSSANSTSSRGGQGGGGNAGLARGQGGSNGLADTGGGGGGGANILSGVGGNGGSGIVIIRYRKPPADIITETISGIVGTADRYTIFPYTGTGTTKDYSFTTTESLSCDILMIGGGGGGGVGDAGGGGAGACIVAINQSLNIGNYTVRVGNGGIGGILSSTSTITRLSTDGVNSSILNSSGVEIYKAVGGGRAGNIESADYSSITQFIGKTGGCGGGAGFWQGNSGVSGGAVSSLNIVNGVSSITPSVSTTYGVYGNVGGNSVFWNNSYPNANCGGGGGIGAAGSAGVISRSGVGGNGLAQVTINSTQYNFKTYFAPDCGSFGVLSGGLLYIGGGEVVVDMLQ